MLCLFILFTTKQSHVLLNELGFNKKIDLVQGIEQLTKINADLKKSTDRILITYEIYYNVTDEKAFVRETMTLPVVEETVLQNMVQTVETNEEVRQEDLEAFLHLFKRNVSNKSKRIGRSTGSLKESRKATKINCVYNNFSL